MRGDDKAMRRWIEQRAGGKISDQKFQEIVQHQRLITARYERDPDLGARQPMECTGCGRATAGREILSETKRQPLCEKCAEAKGY